MLQCPTAVSYTSLTVDKIITMKPCLKVAREGAGEKLVMLERVFFPLNFRAWRAESPRRGEKALTMSIDKDAEIAGKIWLYGWDISLKGQLIFFVHLLLLDLLTRQPAIFALSTSTGKIKLKLGDLGRKFGLVSDVVKEEPAENGCNFGWNRYLRWITVF